MIDVSIERLVDLATYARLRPPGRNGKAMHRTTAYRHATQGVRGVRLETVRLGGAVYTSMEAIQRFLDHLTFGEEPPVRAKARPQRHEAAMAAVEATRLFGKPGATTSAAPSVNSVP